MRIFRLTGIGYAFASTPSNVSSDEYRVASFMRRHGNVRTDEQITDFFGGDRMKARLVINNLMRGDAPRVIEVGSH